MLLTHSNPRLVKVALAKLFSDVISHEHCLIWDLSARWAAIGDIKFDALLAQRSLALGTAPDLLSM